MKKRLLAWILSFALALSLLPVGVLAAEPHPFQDVPSDHWANEAVQYVYEEGLMDGVGPTTFAPGGTLTRAMFVTILGRQDGVAEDSQGENPFTDVADGQWYTPYVTWAAQEDIVGGYGDNRFGPTDPITREQMAAILYRYAQYKGYDTSETGSLDTFPDAGEVSEYAVAPMEWTVGTGLIAGMEDNTLRPQGTATRAQAATLLMRFCETVVGEPQPEPTTYTVTFDWNYDNKGTYTTANVEEGQTVQAPANPTRSGYTFAGWYTQATGGEQFDFDSAVTGDVTVYAHWNKVNGGGGTVQPPVETETFTVTFDSNGGSAVEEQQVEAGEVAKEPNAPTRDEYVFTGWYTDNACTTLYNFDQGVQSNLTLYAGWTDGIYIRDTSEEHVQRGEVEIDGIKGPVDYADNELTLAMDLDADRDTIEEIIAPYQGTIIGQIKSVGHYQIALGASYTLDELQALADEIKQNPQVQDVFISYITYTEACTSLYNSYANAWYPNDDFNMSADDNISGDIRQFYDIWQRGNSSTDGEGARTWGLNVANVPQAWNIARENGVTSGIRVGIIDKGCVSNHPDLKDLHFLGAYYDDWEDEDIDHGTHVAGIIGATGNNEIGTAGIAIDPDMYAVSVAEHKHIVAAIAEAIEGNCKVINMSLGNSDFLGQFSHMLHKKEMTNMLSKFVDQGKDFLLVTAAGNGGNNGANSNYSNELTVISDETVKQHILVVGNAWLKNGTLVRSEDSTFEGNRVDIMAPGSNIFSTVSDGYDNMSGTSMASPFVAGVAALIAQSTSLSMTEIRDIILDTADIDVEDSTPNMVNAGAAMEAALQKDSGTVVLHEMDTRSIELALTDEQSGEALQADSVTMDVLGYAGPHNYSGEEREAMTHTYTLSQVSSGSEGTYSSTGEISLNDGLYQVSLSNMKGYSETTAFLNVTRDTHVISITVPSTGTTTETTISGTVIDANSKAPIADVSVYLNCVFGSGGVDLATSTKTAEDGSFSLTVPTNVTGIDSLEFSKDGYEKKKELVEVQGIPESLSVGTIPLAPISSSGDPQEPQDPQDPGDGTASNPYKISTAEQLAALAQQVNDGDPCDGVYYELTGNIDLSAYSSWTPIGNDTTRFQGNFDGNDYQISNMKITGTGTYRGLFGYLHEATVSDLSLVNVQISLTSGQAIGGITGGAWASTVTDCSVSGTFSVPVTQRIDLMMGGIVGIVNGNSTISNCSNAANINGGTGDHVGGVAGYAYASMNSTIQILGCDNSGQVTGGEHTGDIAGYSGASSGSQIIIQ